MEKMKKEYIWAMYAGMIIVLWGITWLITRKKPKSWMWQILAIVVGGILSVILWVTVGKKNSY